MTTLTVSPSFLTLPIQPPPKDPTAIAEWFMIIDQEEGETLAAEIIDCIVAKGQEVLFEKHIESQVLPYAVQFAKSTLLKIVEWQFFRRDSDEILPATWDPDTEPTPIPADSWSRGAIPIKPSPSTPAFTTHTIPLKKQSNLLSSSRGNLLGSRTLGASGASLGSLSRIAVAKSAEGVAGVVQKPVDVGSRKLSTRKLNSQSLTNTAASGTHLTGSRSGVTNSAKSRKQLDLDSGSGDRVVNGVVEGEMVARAIVLENKRVVNRIHGLEREGQKPDVGYDSEGRILMIRKAGASKLFTHGVKSRIVSTEDKPSQQIPQSVSTSEPVFTPQPPTTRSTRSQPTSKRIRNNNTKQKTVLAAPSLVESRGVLGGSVSSLQSMEDVGAGSSGGGGLSGQRAVGGFVPDTTLDIPLLTETMRLAPGVVLKEGEVIKRGPPATTRKPPSRPLVKYESEYTTSSPPKEAEAEIKTGLKSVRSNVPLSAMGGIVSGSKGSLMEHGTGPSRSVLTGHEEKKQSGSVAVTKTQPVLRSIPFPSLAVREPKQ